MPTWVRVYLVALSALASYQLWLAHKTGKVRGKWFRIVDRSEERGAYIVMIVALSVMVVVFIALAIWSA